MNGDTVYIVWVNEDHKSERPYIYEICKDLETARDAISLMVYILNKKPYVKDLKKVDETFDCSIEKWIWVEKTKNRTWNKEIFVTENRVI